jgi:TolB-like protein
MLSDKRTLVLAGALCFGSAQLRAQCPDGSPPPCVRAARRDLPSAAERGRRFLILPFRNVTRAPDQDWMVEGATTMLGDALGRWREITVVSDEQLYPALRRHALVPGTIMDPARVRAAATETGGWTVVSGEVIATGGSLRVSARAVDVVTGREVARASHAVPTGTDVRVAFERVSSGLLRPAGLDSATIDLGAGTTSSLDSFRAYLRGVALANRAQFRQARDALLESIHLDSTFARPYYAIALASLFVDPMGSLSTGSIAQHYAARAVQLGTQLPPTSREVAGALNAILDLRFTAARTALERLVAADSNDLSALGLLSLVEYSDPLLVPSGNGERPRGSLNRNNRLARRILDLDPTGHGAFIPLIYSHLLAAGDLPGMVVGVRREAGSFGAMFFQGSTRVFVPILRDSFELIPAESLATVPADEWAASRRRALDGARGWVNRWLAIGPGDGEAHLAAARVIELEGDYNRAFRELAIADSLGIGAGLTNAGARRLALLAKLGRYRDGLLVADDLWARGMFASVSPLPFDPTEALAWAFNLFLMRGDFLRADSALARMTAALQSIVSDSGLAASAAVRMLSGSPAGTLWQLELPAGFRADVMDSLWTRRATLPPDGRIATAVPTLQRLAAAAALRDSALAARVRAAPWFRP